MKYLLFLLLLAGCTNQTPKVVTSEPREGTEVFDGGGTISYAKAITNGTFVWVDTVGNQELTITSKEVNVTDKDTVIVTNNYTTRTLDTTWRTLTTVPPIPPDTTTPPPVSGYALTFQSGYDKISDITYGGNGQYGNGTISTTVYKTGPGSFYSRPANVSSGIRSEVQYNEAAQNPIEGAVEYDIMYEVVVANNGVSVQWHPNNSKASGSGNWHDGGRFDVTRCQWNYSQNTSYNYYQHDDPNNNKNMQKIETGRWYHIRWEYKFSQGSDGYLRMFIDDSKYYTYNGLFGDPNGQYIKIGYNGWDSKSATSRLYVDNLKIYKKL